MFYGESMFSFHTNASKVAFVYLAIHMHHWGFPLLDCQLPSAHLSSLGAESISRNKYINLMTSLCAEPTTIDWKMDESLTITDWKNK